MGGFIAGNYNAERLNRVWLYETEIMKYPGENRILQIDMKRRECADAGTL